MKIQFLFLVPLLFACKKEDELVPATELYFPPASGTWETVTPASLGWDESQLSGLRSFLITSNSRALIVLKDVKIVIEEEAAIECS